MGRKRKTRAQKKNSSSKKQVKLEDTDNSTIDDSPAVVKQSPKRKANFTIKNAPASPSKKSWVDKCRQWVDEQKEVAEPPPLEPEVNDETPMEEPAQTSPGTDLPLRQVLKDFSEKEILNSVMYECEWLKCGFETTEDLKYMTHVEAHVYQYLAEKTDSEGKLIR